jgi:alkyldihydroxyacetonephosphate synthase
LDHGVLMDTFETATTWNSLPTLYQKLEQAIAEAARLQNTPALVMAHIAHGSRESASLEITFFARMLPGNEIAQWEAIKRAAIECIVANGGSLSHHSGIGYEHAAWMEREYDALSMAVLTAVKTELDPDNVMNPGKWLKPKVVDKQEPGTEERYWNLPKRKD